MRNKRKTLIFAITLLVLCFGIGYAYLTTTLSINGTTDIDSNNWDIYFDNVQVTTGSVTGTQVTQAPTIDNTTKTTVSFHIRLKEPGEFYEFTVDAKNGGTIDAMIELLTKAVNNSTTIPEYLNYSVTYGMGSPIQQKQILRANRQVTYKVRVEYRTDIDSDALPTTAQTLNLSFGVEYIQADSTGIDNRRVIYSNEYNTGIGEPFLEERTGPWAYTYYDTFEEMNNSPENILFAVKITGENDTIVDADPVYSINGTTYSLKHGGSTFNELTGDYDNDSIYLANNINILKNSFGEENCEMSTVYPNITHYSCFDDDIGLRAYAYGNGIVGASQMGKWDCGVGADGSIICGG